jgi:hypothetical protein
MSREESGKVFLWEIYFLTSADNLSIKSVQEE